MLRGSLYIFGSKMTGYFLRILLPILLVRILSKADFGSYRQFFLLEVLITTLFQLGVNQALFYFIPRDERNAGAYFINSLVLNVLIFSSAFLVVGFFTTPLSRQLNMPILHDMYPALVAYILFLVLITSADCYLLARNRVRASAAYEMLGQLLAAVFTAIVALRTRNLQAILTSLVVARLIILALMMGDIHFRLRGFRAERYFIQVAPQIRYGLVLGLSGTFMTLLQQLHNFMISRYAGTEAFAVYSAGCTEVPLLPYYAQALAVVALGRLAQLEKEGKWEEISGIWDSILVSLYGLAVPLTLLLLLVAKPLILLMFTTGYADAVGIFRVNTLLKLNLLWNATLVLRAMKRNDVTLWVHLGLLILAVPVLRLGWQLGGALGVITAQFGLIMVSRLLPMIIMNRLAPRPLAYGVKPRDVWRFYVSTWDRLRAGLRIWRSARGGTRF
jgi:O-antigen/teichoic acid export membrane protein